MKKLYDPTERDTASRLRLPKLFCPLKVACQHRWHKRNSNTTDRAGAAVELQGAVAVPYHAHLRLPTTKE